MAAAGEDAVTRWFSDLKAGDRGEGPRLLERSFHRRLSGSLADESLRAVAPRKLEGRSHE